MTIKNKIIALMISLIAMPTFAQAKEGKARFGLDAGYAYADIKAEETCRDIGAVTSVSCTWDNATPTLRAFVDYGIQKNLAVELGYFVTDSLDATYTVSGASAAESSKAQGFDLSLVYKQNDDQGFFVKGGVHRAKVDGEASLRIGSTTYSLGSGSETGISWLAGLGYEGKINDTTSWRAGLSYYNDLGNVSGADATLVYVGVVF
jgi:hypothetical protein